MKASIRIAVVFLFAALGILGPLSVLAENAPPLAPVNLTLQLKNAELKEVLVGISKATGIEIRIYDDVQGKVTYKGEKEPVETVVDQVLRSVGYKNYVMAQEGGEARKIWILPKGKESEDADAKGRMKLRGKLRNGKEIEYFPGEIVVGINNSMILTKQVIGGVEGIIDNIGKRYSLALIDKFRYKNGADNHICTFRLLNNVDPLTIYYRIIDEGRWDGFIAVVTPNGLGPLTAEMPDLDFQIIKSPVTYDEKQFIRDNPFIKRRSDGRLVFEKVLFLSVGALDVDKFNYDDVLSMMSNLGGIILGYGRGGIYKPSTLYKENYTIYFPKIESTEEHEELLIKIQKHIESLSLTYDSVTGFKYISVGVPPREL